MKIIRVTEELREKLTAVEHERWSGWMRYLFSKSTKQENGCYLIPKCSVDRWKRQMNTEYKDLSKGEKKSDRELVNETLRECKIEDVVQIITKIEVEEIHGRDI